MKLSVEKSVLELLPEGNMLKTWLRCQSAWLVDLNSRPEENVFERILNKLLQIVLWCFALVLVALHWRVRIEILRRFGKKASQEP